MALINLTESSSGTTFKLEENDIIKVFTNGSQTLVEAVYGENSLVKTLKVDESAATIDSNSEVLISTTLNGDSVYLNKLRVINTYEIDSLARVTYDNNGDTTEVLTLNVDEATFIAAIPTTSSGNSIYNGNGTVPTSTVATLTDTLSFNGGNIGIGTATPSATLDVIGNAKIGVSTPLNNEKLVVSNSTVNQGILRLTDIDGAGGVGVLVAANDSLGNYTVNFGSNALNRTLLQGNKSAIYIDRQQLQGSAAGSQIGFNAGGTFWGIGVNIMGADTFDCFVDAPTRKFNWGYATNGISGTGTPFMTLNSTGLGIGTATPLKKLDIVGGTIISTNTLLEGLTLNEYSGTLPNALTFAQGGTTTVVGATKFQLGVSNGNGQFMLGTVQGDSVIEATQKLFFTSVNTTTPSMVLSGSNLGIGTATPEQSLHTTGRVKLDNQTAPATPTGGGVIYVEGGALKYIGSSGTITTLGVA